MNVTITTLRDGNRYLIQIWIDAEVREIIQACMCTVQRKRTDAIDRWCNESSVLEVTANEIPWPLEFKRERN